MWRSAASVLKNPCIEYLQILQTVQNRFENVTYKIQYIQTIVSLAYKLANNRTNLLKRAIFRGGVV